MKVQLHPQTRVYATKLESFLGMEVDDDDVRTDMNYTLEEDGGGMDDGGN
jgi:hypothetical protein